MQGADSVQFARVDLRWVGANRMVQIEKMKPTARTFNYYNLPHNPDGVTNVREFESVRISEVYPGIDVRFYNGGGFFEHDYELAPGADYQNIRIEISGTEAALNSSGELVLPTYLGTITESSPVVFQNGKELMSYWVEIEKNVWGFEIPDANPDLAMIIDPISRVWGTYYGGSSLDEILYSKFDPSGNLYVAGGTQSVNNIATAGTQQTVSGGSLDAFLAKFDEDGNQVWGTYIGGSGQEELWGCDFDNQGHIYVTGRTNSTSNISTPGSHQPDYGGGGLDGFVQKYSTEGIRIWGTYYGGEEFDRGRYCHVDAAGFLYMAGVTKSFTNISTPGSHQEVYGGAGQNQQDDAILIKFTPDGERIWGTYYGGIQWEEGYSCATDSELNVYLYGHAQSSTNISTAGSHQPNHGGGLWDSFLAKFNTNGVRQWGTYIGGSNQDLSWTCSIDEDDYIYMTGRTASTNGISTVGAYQLNNGGDFDAYLLKFSTAGEQVWGTYFGGAQYDRGFGCRAVENGRILISGQTESSENIASPGAHQSAIGGGIDAFLALFDQDGSLYWSTYYGGAQNDVGRSTAYFNQAYYLTGWTMSNTNISTSGIHQEEYAGARDAFIAKFVECEVSSSSISATACNTYTAPDGEILSESGDYTAVILNDSGCDSVINIALTILPVFEDDQTVILCDGETHILPDGVSVNSGGTYVSEFTTIAGCDSIINTVVEVAENYSLSYTFDLCENDSLTDPEGNPISNSGEYTFQLTSTDGCDSVIHWTVDVFRTFLNTANAQICEGEEYISPGGQIFTEEGVFEEVFITASGCDSIYITNLSVLPVYNFVVDTTICENQTYTLPDGTNVNEQGVYILEYVTQNGCDSTYFISLTVTSDIIISESFDWCVGQSIQLPDGTVAQPEEDTIYQITISGANGCDSIFNIDVTVVNSFEVNTVATICFGEEYQLPDGEIVSSPGNYTTISITTGGCDSIVNTSLEVVPIPELTFDIPDAFCFEEGFVPLNPTPSGGVLSGSFVEGNGLNLSDAPPGSYSVLYEYVDDNGCTNESEETFAILPNTEPAFDYTADCLFLVHFFNNTDGESLDFTWIVDGFVISEEAELSYQFHAAGEYEVVLTTINVAGCEYQNHQSIYLNDGFSPDEFWAPNVITPNGDGINDVFRVMPADQNCLEYEIRIFNRWGMRVYVSTHNGIPFSGRNNSGQELPDGIYFYVLESAQIDCEQPDWEELCRGTITILR